MLWAALYDRSPTTAPTGTVWLKQVLEPLLWIQAFLQMSCGTVVRVFECEQYFNRGPEVLLYFDACTTGFGGFITMNNVPVEYTFGRFTQMDSDTLGITNEQSRAQQGFEALALLIMMRLWLWHLTQKRVSIRVRGDNLGALSLLCRMQPKSASLQLVAREIALEISQCAYAPDLVEHVPGITNVIADLLSRHSELGEKFQLPESLSQARFIAPPLRDSRWWRTKRAARS